MQIINILANYISGLNFVHYKAVPNYLDMNKACMSISPMPDNNREYDILGNFTEDYNFMIQIKLVDPSIVDSYNAMGLLNQIGLYFEEACKDKELLPTLEDNQEIESLRINGGPSLESRDDRNNEVYMCIYTLRYKQYT
jgi:hypothetical protein